MNVDGTTIHSFLKIPTQGESMALRGAALREFQLILRTVRFITIDEYSMIGLRLLYKIHCRLREGTGRSDQPFGGVFLYLFGELRQLPLVMDVPIYMPPSEDASAQDRGVDCWRKQLPITLAYALTIHKAQGLTLDKVCVDLGDQEQAPGASYVALSRVRRLEDLLIARPIDFSRLKRINAMRHIRVRVDFIATMTRALQ